MKNINKKLRLILGDQLNTNHSWFKSVDDDVLYIMMEVRQETDYVMHHVQKVLAFFASMREFAKQLKNDGHRVHYIKLDDPGNFQSITENLCKIIQQNKITQFEYQFPDEYRLDQQMSSFCESLSIATKAVDSEHFLSERHDVKQHFEGKKQFLMESFYRMMRKRYNIFMENGKPVGDKWNYDVENRKKYDGRVPVPEPLVFQNNVKDLQQLLRKMDVNTFGANDNDTLIWPINQIQA